MPILVVQTQPKDPDDARPAPEQCPTLTLRTLDGGDVMPLGVYGYVVRAQCQGLDLAPREVVRRRVPGMSGSRIVSVDDLERVVRLPLWLSSTDGRIRSVLTSLARIDEMADWRGLDYVTAEGTFDLVATDPDVNGARYLRVTYVDGMEGDYDTSTAYPGWRIFGLTLLAVDPDWIGDEWSTPVLRIPTLMPFLTASTQILPFGAKLVNQLSTIGSETLVRVGGNLPAHPLIEVTGPATSVHATGPDGMDVTLGAVTAGQTVVLDTGRRKRLLLNGAVAPASLLGAWPKWGTGLVPGDARITIDVVGPGLATTARVYGRERWRRWVG